MPEIYGSSRIRNVSGISTLVGPTGSTGPAGPTGSTGATGTTGAGGTFGVGIFSGLTGASGGDGVRFFREGEYGGDFITFYLTDGTTLGISGARGATGEAGDDFIISNTITDAGYGGVFDYKNGITAYFRNLTVSGRDIEIESNDYSVLLRGITYDSGILGNTGELLYQFDGLSAQGAKNTYWDNANNNLLARILVHKEADDSNNLTESGTNYSTVVSPSKLEGDVVPFTYHSETVENIDDPDPSQLEKPFEGFSSVSGLHLGKTADDAGVEYDWVYTFPGLTFSEGITAAIIGSCCYCEDKGTNDQDAPNCIDYVTKQYCSNVGGVFDGVHTCIERPEGPNCYVDGACCLFSEEGRTCVQTVAEKCERFGGFFIPDLTCDELEVLGDEDNPIGCPNPCRVDGACCINNVCFEMTEYECSLNPNGSWIPDRTCAEVNCCTEAQFGACCLDEVCYNTTPLDCTTYKSTDGSTGIYWGLGSKCAGPFEESRYYAYDCTNSNGELVGRLDENGLCADGNPPPCTSECLGWTQIVQDECVNEDGVENICKCLEDVGGPYQCDCDCNACGGSEEDEQSCGSIKLADGSCWECCCSSDNLPTTTTTTAAPVSGSCCYYDHILREWNCVPEGFQFGEDSQPVDAFYCLSDWSVNENGDYVDPPDGLDGTWNETPCNESCDEVYRSGVCCKLFPGFNFGYECTETENEFLCNEDDIFLNDCEECAAFADSIDWDGAGYGNGWNWDRNEACCPAQIYRTREWYPGNSQFEGDASVRCPDGSFPYPGSPCKKCVRDDRVCPCWKLKWNEDGNFDRADECGCRLYAIPRQLMVVASAWQQAHQCPIYGEDPLCNYDDSVFDWWHMQHECKFCFGWFGTYGGGGIDFDNVDEGIAGPFCQMGSGNREICESDALWAVAERRRLKNICEELYTSIEYSRYRCCDYASGIDENCDGCGWWPGGALAGTGSGGGGCMFEGEPLPNETCCTTYQIPPVEDPCEEWQP